MEVTKVFQDEVDRLRRMASDCRESADGLRTVTRLDPESQTPEMERTIFDFEMKSIAYSNMADWIVNRSILSLQPLEKQERRWEWTLLDETGNVKSGDFTGTHPQWLSFRSTLKGPGEVLQSREVSGDLGLSRVGLGSSVAVEIPAETYEGWTIRFHVLGTPGRPGARWEVEVVPPGQSDGQVVCTTCDYVMACSTARKFILGQS